MAPAMTADEGRKSIREERVARTLIGDHHAHARTAQATSNTPRFCPEKGDMLLMGQDPCSPPLHRSRKGKNRRAECKQNRSHPHMSALSPYLWLPQSRRIRFDLGRRLRRNPQPQPNARFPGWWFPLTSSVSWKAVLRWWNVPIVPQPAPWNRMVESCGPSSHDKRKMQTRATSRRWARIDSLWKVVGS